MQSVQILVSGRVQGVFFRVYTQRYVRNNLKNVTGYVKNLPDGRVEIVAEGMKDSLEKLVSWAKTQGSPHSKIDHTEVIWKEIIQSRFFEFKIEH